MTLTREDRQALLVKIDELVTTKYYDPSYGGNDWKAIVSCYCDEILDAETSQEFETCVAALLRQLPSTELGLLGPSTKIQPRSSINASFRAVLTNSMGHVGYFKTSCQEAWPRTLAFVRATHFFRSRALQPARRSLHRFQ